MLGKTRNSVVSVELDALRANGKGQQVAAQQTWTQTGGGLIEQKLLQVVGEPCDVDKTLSALRDGRIQDRTQ